jgi:hypothetical protein
VLTGFGPSPGCVPVDVEALLATEQSEGGSTQTVSCRRLHAACTSWRHDGTLGHISMPYPRSRLRSRSRTWSRLLTASVTRR